MNGPGRRALRSLLLPATLLLIAPPVRGDVRFEVTGGAHSLSDGIEVEVEVRNLGSGPAARLTVTGELSGRQDEARLSTGVPSRASRRVLLHFPLEAAGPGTYAVTLLLDWIPGAPGAPESAASQTQRAFLLLAFGEATKPAVRLSAAELRLERAGTVRVRVESHDGAAHRLRVRALTARGLTADPASAEIQVPAAGAVELPLRLLRGGAPWNTRHGILVVAETLNEATVRTSAITAEVEVGSDPAWLPLLRRPLQIVAALLFVWAAAREVRWRRKRR